MEKPKLKSNVAEDMSRSLRTVGPNGVHPIKLDTSKNVNPNLNLTSFHAATVIAALDCPKTYIYNIGGDIQDLHGMAKLLTNKDVREEVINVISTPATIVKIIELITSSQGGTFATDIDSISFDMVKERIFRDIKVNSITAYVLANIFTPFRTIMGLAAASNQIQFLEAETNIYPTKEELINELIIQQLVTSLKDIDYSFLKNDKKRLGVADIANKFERALYPLVMKFNTLSSIARSYEAVLALVRAFVSKNFDEYSAEEIHFFKEERFINLAYNYTVIKHALEVEYIDDADGKRAKAKPNRPAIGDMYWMQSVERISSGINSSNKYSIIEINTIKEFYSVTNIVDIRGFKKGVVISRNFKENSKLATYRRRSIGMPSDGLSRLYEDKTTESVLSGIYSTLSSLDSTKIHNFAAGALQNIVSPETDYFLYTINVPNSEIEYLSFIFSNKVMISIRDDEKVSPVEFAYGVDIKDSLVSDELKTFFSYGVVNDPYIALFYSKDYEGKRAIVVDTNPITQTKNVLFSDIESILTAPLAGPITFKLDYNGLSLKPKWDLAELTGLVDLNDVHSTIPLVGSIIFDQLLNTHSELSSYFRKEGNTGSLVGIYKDALESLNLQFLSLLLPILRTKDIDHLLSSAISQLWSTGAFTGTRFGASILTENHVKNELRVRLVLFVAAKLGFINDEKQIKSIIGLLNSTKSFDRLIME